MLKSTSMGVNQSFSSFRRLCSWFGRHSFPDFCSSSPNRKFPKERNNMVMNRRVFVFIGLINANKKSVNLATIISLIKEFFQRCYKVITASTAGGTDPKNFHHMCHFLISVTSGNLLQFFLHTDITLSELPHFLHVK